MSQWKMGPETKEDLKMLLVLKMEGRVMSQGMKVALKVGKGEKIDVPLRPPEGTG